MKLRNELPYIRERFSMISDLYAYAICLKASGDYKNFGTRLAWDCIHASIPTKVICSWYDKYKCNDDHITTAAKAVLKEMGVL